MNKARITRAVVVAFVIATAIFAFWIFPHAKTISAIHRARVGLEQQIASKNANIAMGATIQDREHRAEEVLHASQFGTMTEARAAEMIALTKAAQRRGVRLTISSIDTDEKLSLTADGKQNSILLFLDDLDQLPMTLAVSSLSLTPAPTGIVAALTASLVGGPQV